MALALLTVAKAVRPGNPNPDVCFYLGDRYWCLAEYCKERGSVNKPSAFEKRLKDTCNAAARGAVRPMLRPWLCLCLGGRRLLKRLVGARE